MAYYDPTKLAAAEASQGAGADGRTVLQGANLLNVLGSVQAPTYVPQMLNLGQSTGDSGSGETSYDPTPAYYQSSDGKKLSVVDGSQYGDPNGHYYSDTGDNPSSPGGKDVANIVYKVNADGTATPVSANNSYNPSNWSDWGRLTTELGATLATAGAAGYAVAGAGAAGGAGGGATVGGSSLGGLAATDGGAAMATSAPAYGGVGTAGAGAGTDAIVGGSSQLGNAGFIGSLQAGDYGGALSAAGTNVGNYLSTPGGLQSAAGLLGAIGGAAGAGSGLNSATNTTQNTVDPRVAQYVYGANENGGLLGNVNSLMNSQLATGGLNATQTQGLNMQLAALNDPAYGASLQQMRNSGSGLLGQSVAGNPFTSGQASLSAPANSQIQAGQAQVPGFQPMQTQLNNPQRPGPNMTGLLGNLRPTGS